MKILNVYKVKVINHVPANATLDTSYEEYWDRWTTKYDNPTISTHVVIENNEVKEGGIYVNATFGYIFKVERFIASFIDEGESK